MAPAPAPQAKSRALVVRRGSPASSSVVVVPQRQLGEGEVLVKLQAAALTPADALLCQGPAPLPELLGLPPSAALVPGCFFYGEVLAVGPYVEGLEKGEPVLGVVDGAALAPSRGNAPEAVGAGADEEGTSGGGCYREAVRVHFSALLPAAELAAANLHPPVVVAHVPPMVSAVFCVASQLRLRAGEALLVIAPRLGDVAFLLQRLLLIGDAWSGPLYLILLQGHAPARADLERHPHLRPLLPQLDDDGAARPSPRSCSAGGSFLDDFVSWSAEEHLQQRGAAGMQPEQAAEGLRELVGRAAALTRGAGFDVVLALDVELAPPEPTQPPELSTRLADAEVAAGAAVALDLPSRPSTLLRTLLGALAVRGRLVTNCRKVEMMPADSEHLWLKEGSLSFFNPHSLFLSGARHGALLHAMAEVAGRLARGELPVADAEVVQYRLFEQFHPALEAVVGRGGRGAGGPGPQLVALVV